MCPSSFTDQDVTHKFWSHHTGSNIAWSREERNSSPKERLHCTLRFSFEAGFYKLVYYFSSVPAGRLSGCKIKKRIIRKFDLINQNYQESSCQSPDSGFSSLFKKSRRLCSEVQLPALNDYPRNREHLK